VFSGTGIEGNLNSSFLLSCTWAQPSDLFLMNNTLFIADSESSTIRAIDLSTQIAYNVVGGDGNPKNLFSFGDQDGEEFTCKLQHPLAVIGVKDKLVVCDSYNNKLKFVYPKSKYCLSFVGEKEGGLNDSKVLMKEPSGLAVKWVGEDWELFVADSNNDCI